MFFVYLITYQKKNGELLHRKRNSLPGNIGDETSMGWIIQDIQYQFGNKYYNFIDYKKISRKYFSKTHKIRTINNYIKKYGTSVALIILIPLYLFK